MSNSCHDIKCQIVVMIRGQIVVIIRKSNSCHDIKCQIVVIIRMSDSCHDIKCPLPLKSIRRTL